MLDYDDTLLPTSFLDPEDEEDMENLAKIHKDELTAIEDQAVKMLESFL